MPETISERDAIATILVNQRIMRNGSPPISNALDLLPAKLRDEVLQDAQAVVDGLNASRIPDPETTKSLKYLHDWFNVHPEYMNRYLGSDVCKTAAEVLSELTTVSQDLLAALKELKIWWANWMPDDAAAQGGREALNNARAAVKKAEGR